MKTYLGGSSETEFKDMQWNIDLDLKLFDTTPPEGYKDVTPNLTRMNRFAKLLSFLRYGRKPAGATIREPPATRCGGTSPSCSTWPSGGLILA